MDALQDIKVEGLEVMKLLMERRKVELKEEEEAAEAKLSADREVRLNAAAQGIFAVTKAAIEEHTGCRLRTDRSSTPAP